METVTFENFKVDSFTENGAYRLQKDFSNFINTECFYTEKDKLIVCSISVSKAFKNRTPGNDEFVYPVHFDFMDNTGKMVQRVYAEHFMKFNKVEFDRTKYVN